MTVPKTPAAPVTPALAETIRTLRRQLRAEFGCDYAYTIVGNGAILAAESSALGDVEPAEKPVYVLTAGAWSHTHRVWLKAGEPVTIAQEYRDGPNAGRVSVVDAGGTPALVDRKILRKA